MHPLSAASTGAAELVPLNFGGQQSLGIYQPAASEFLVLMVNGGAQTRAGSHRMQQQLALHWQQAGFASLRFDFPGFGDADGEPGTFVDHAAYLTELPPQLARYFGKVRPIVLFGLCDGATAALLASPWLQPQALILLNPWCRTAENHARTMLKFYYLRRIVSAEFWRKLATGQWHALDSLKAILKLLGPVQKQHSSVFLAPEDIPHDDLKRFTPDSAVPQAMLNWKKLPCQVQLILSGADLTAAECRELLQLPQYRCIAAQLRLTDIVGANHTVTDPEHFVLLQSETTDFLRTKA
jgi:hypothetical protein